MRHVEARAGAYADSVTLMQVTAQAQAIPGVQAALVAMATDLNLGLLADLGLQPPDRAGPNDMLVAVQADDGESLATALAAVDNALRSRPADQAGAAEQPPRTTFSAARRAGTGLALISVPGQFAFIGAVDALGRRGGGGAEEQRVPSRSPGQFRANRPGQAGLEGGGRSAFARGGRAGAGLPVRAWGG